MPCTEAGFTTGARAEGNIVEGEAFIVGIAVGMAFAEDVVEVAFAIDEG